MIGSAPVDLDRFETWPAGLRETLVSHAAEIINERASDFAFHSSERRYFEPSPPMPVTERMHALIADRMHGRELLVFHATRLLNFDEVTRGGLRALALAERMNRLEQFAGKGALKGFDEDLRQALARVQIDRHYRPREGQVWATPLRRKLHDGGCAVFFDHWGGEAVQRIAGEAAPALAQALKRIGKPAIVGFRMPAFGLCCFGDGCLAPTMIGIALERAGHNFPFQAWDVLIKQNVPADWIEFVVKKSEPNLAWPPR